MPRGTTVKPSNGALFRKTLVLLEEKLGKHSYAVLEVICSTVLFLLSQQIAGKVKKTAGEDDKREEILAVIILYSGDCIVQSVLFASVLLLLCKHTKFNSCTQPHSNSTFKREPRRPCFTRGAPRDEIFAASPPPPPINQE